MLNLNSCANLSNGQKMPLLGLGTWQVSNTEAYNAVRFALDHGYRHIDTARIYGNEDAVGRAVRDSGIPRAEIWVTTKLFLFYGFNAGKMFADSFAKLGLDYVDLLLIHFPLPGLVTSNWRKLEKIYEQGTVRSLGISNHSIKQTEAVLKMATVKPVVNQARCSPYNYKPDLHRYLQEKNIFLEAYSPLTRGHKLQDARLTEIAAHYQKTPAQVLIRWCLQHELIVIPKTVHENRIIENANVYDFEITTEDMQLLDGFTE